MGVGELWRLLTEDRKEKQNEYSALTNGHAVNGFPVGGRNVPGLHGRGKARNGGYWWSQ